MSKEYTYENLAAHKTEGSCWLAITGKVYDVTKFLHDHPGGMDTIIDSSGRDATDQFEAIGHSKQARDMLDKYLIGTLKGDPSAAGGGGKKGKSAASSSGDCCGTGKPCGSCGFYLSVVVALGAIAVGLYILSTGKIPGMK